MCTTYVQFAYVHVTPMLHVSKIRTFPQMCATYAQAARVQTASVLHMNMVRILPPKFAAECIVHPGATFLHIIVKNTIH